MPNEFAPAIAALVRDPETGLFAAGFSAKPQATHAASKAVLEAVHTWIYTQGTVSSDGWVFQAIEAGLMARGLHLEHREDRRYLDDAGEDFRHVRDLGAHVQVWQDSRLSSLARRFTDPQLGMVPVQQIRDVPPQLLRRRLKEAGLHIIAKDLTTPDIAQTSLSVARVLIPGLVPNAPAAFGYYGMPRFARAAQLHGWPLPRAREDFLLAPAPHM